MMTPTLRRLSLTTLVACLLLLLTGAPVSAQGDDQLYWCWADCRDCAGQGPFDCFTIACQAVGHSVSCASGCCLWTNFGYCYSWYNPVGPTFFTLECGILDPGGWLQGGDESAKSCLDLGVQPVERPDGLPNWVMFDASRLDATLVASSPGFTRALGEIDQDSVNRRAAELLSDLEVKIGRPVDEGLLVAIYPPADATQASIRLEALYGQPVATSADAKATFEVTFDARGVPVAIQAVHWSNEAIVQPLMPVLERALRVEVGRRATAERYHGLVELTVGGGEIAAVVSNTFAVN